MASSLTINSLLLNEPDWSTNPKYKVSFKTAIQTDIEGVERRTALLSTPMRSFSYRITETGSDAIKLRSKLYSKMASNWGIPLWIDYTTLTSQAAATQTTINVNTIAYKHFYVGGYCIIITANDTYEYKQISSLTATTITFATGLSGTWAAGTPIYPLMISRIGKSIDNNQKSAGVFSVDITAQEMFYSDRNSYAAVEPEYLQLFDPTGAAIYPLYVFSPDHNWAADRKIKLINKYDDLQYLADQYIYNHWTETGQIHEFNLNLYSCEEIYQLENLFNHLNGRCFNFLLPSGVIDVKLSANALETDTTLSIADTGFADYYTDSGTPYTTAKYIEIRQPNNDRVYCEIQSATNTVLTLTTVIGTAITDYGNCMVSLMAEARFLQDEIAIEYISQTIAKTKFSCKMEHGDLVSRYDMGYTPDSPPIEWTEFATMTIDSTKIDETLTDFPVLLNITAASGTGDTDLTGVFAQTGTEYTRFLCKTSAGDEIYADIERWDSVNNTAQLHIKIPSISSSSSTIIKLYYIAETPVSNDYIGMSGSLNAQNVWDANFMLVCHMAQDPSGTAPQMLDSTSNNNDGTSGGSMTSGDLVDGLHGKALDFDGINDYINIWEQTPAPLEFQNIGNNNNYTVSALIKTSATTGGALYWWPDDVIIELRRYGSTDSEVPFSFGIAGGHIALGRTADRDVNPELKSGTITVNNGQWHYLCAVVSDDNVAFYVDGSLDASRTYTVATGDCSPGTSNSTMLVGSRIKDAGAGVANLWEDIIGEISISNIARSAAWIKATYYSLNDNIASYVVT